MKYEEKFPLIDSHLKNQISDKENQELIELRKIPEFEEEYAFRKRVHQGAKQMGREALKERFKQLDKQPKVRRLRTWWSVAAAIAIVALSLPFLFKFNDTKHLYVENYSKLPNKVVPITRSGEEMSDLKMAFIHYQKGEYEDAEQSLVELMEDHPEVQVYRGIIAMEKEDFEKAVSILEKEVTNTASKFLVDAQWYLSLAYIALQNHEKAKQTLSNIKETETFYYPKAQELLSKL